MLELLNTDKFYTKIVNDEYEFYWAEDMSPQAWCMNVFDVPAGSETLLLKCVCKFSGVGQSINTLSYLKILKPFVNFAFQNHIHQ